MKNRWTGGRVVTVAALGLLLAAAPARAATHKLDVPFILDLFVRRSDKGLFVTMPIIDSNPNSGFTFGVMPVWVVFGSSGTLLRWVQAPAITWNRHTDVTIQYQLFAFPTESSDLQFYASQSRRFDREIALEGGNKLLFNRGDRELKLRGRVQHCKDSSRRFFGFGPRTPAAAESNYTLDSVDYRLSADFLTPDRPWHATLRHSLRADDVTNGSVESIPDLEARFPETFRTVSSRRVDATFGVTAGYDSRDGEATTSRGYLADVYADVSREHVLGEYSRRSYGADLRAFLPWGRAGEAEPRFITAAGTRFDYLTGDVPFWALPQMGGKHFHRGYGEGRFVDHGLFLLRAEQRCRIGLLSLPSGAKASVWADPFFVAGTVFPSPGRFQGKYLKPAGGIALRGLARPQIVGSADFAYGLEGLKVFLDVDYAW